MHFFNGCVCFFCRVRSLLYSCVNTRNDRVAVAHNVLDSAVHVLEADHQLATLGNKRRNLLRKVWILLDWVIYMIAGQALDFCVVNIPIKRTVLKAKRNAYISGTLCHIPGHRHVKRQRVAIHFLILYKNWCGNVSVWRDIRKVFCRESVQIYTVGRIPRTGKVQPRHLVISLHAEFQPGRDIHGLR